MVLLHPSTANTHFSPAKLFNMVSSKAAMTAAALLLCPIVSRLFVNAVQLASAPGRPKKTTSITKGRASTASSSKTKPKPSSGPSSSKTKTNAAATTSVNKEPSSATTSTGSDAGSSATAKEVPEVDETTDGNIKERLMWSDLAVSSGEDEDDDPAVVSKELDRIHSLDSSTSFSTKTTEVTESGALHVGTSRSISFGSSADDSNTGASSSNFGPNTMWVFGLGNVTGEGPFPPRPDAEDPKDDWPALGASVTVASSRSSTAAGRATVGRQRANLQGGKPKQQELPQVDKSNQQQQPPVAAGTVAPIGLGKVDEKDRWWASTPSFSDGAPSGRGKATTAGINYSDHDSEASRTPKNNTLPRTAHPPKRTRDARGRASIMLKKKQIVAKFKAKFDHAPGDHAKTAPAAASISPNTGNKLARSSTVETDSSCDPLSSSSSQVPLNYDPDAWPALSAKKSSPFLQKGKKTESSSAAEQHASSIFSATSDTSLLHRPSASGGANCLDASAEVFVPTSHRTLDAVLQPFPPMKTSTKLLDASAKVFVPAQQSTPEACQAQQDQEKSLDHDELPMEGICSTADETGFSSSTMSVDAGAVPSSSTHDLQKLGRNAEKKEQPDEQMHVADQVETKEQAEPSTPTLRLEDIEGDLMTVKIVSATRNGAELTNAWLWPELSWPFWYCKNFLERGLTVRMLRDGIRHNFPPDSGEVNLVVGTKILVPGSSDDERLVSDLVGEMQQEWLMQQQFEMSKNEAAVGFHDKAQEAQAGQHAYYDYEQQLEHIHNYPTEDPASMSGATGSLSSGASFSRSCGTTSHQSQRTSHVHQMHALQLHQGQLVGFMVPCVLFGIPEGTEERGQSYDHGMDMEADQEAEQHAQQPVVAGTEQAHSPSRGSPVTGAGEDVVDRGEHVQQKYEVKVTEQEQDPSMNDDETPQTKAEAKLFLDGDIEEQEEVSPPGILDLLNISREPQSAKIVTAVSSDVDSSSTNEIKAQRFEKGEKGTVRYYTEKKEELGEDTLIHLDVPYLRDEDGTGVDAPFANLHEEWGCPDSWEDLLEDEKVEENPRGKGGPKSKKGSASKSRKSSCAPALMKTIMEGCALEKQDEKMC
ncbi:unnamed protein product [Amoebophrya sp. A120]|nr:unnamed protein product [Amoebophrya sp. A120]|eukprot:GSA120T00007500001.1